MEEENKKNTENNTDKNSALSSFINEAEKNAEEGFGGVDKNFRKRVDYIETANVVPNEYLQLPLDRLPMARFYRPGTVVSIRGAKVKHIQAYSMINNSNVYDVITKMNDMLEATVSVQFPDGSKGSFRDIKDADRLNLIVEVSMITSKNGKTLIKKDKCHEKTCGHENEFPIRPSNYKYYDTDEELEEFFDAETGSYVFELESGKVMRLAPPTIGVQQDISNYMLSRLLNKKEINQSFMICMPWLLWDKNEISSAECDSKYDMFENGMILNENEYQFAINVINRFMFGVEQLKTKCAKCGTEVRTPFGFPDGASTLFIGGGSFRDFLKK
jgi:hypothetical protein